MKKIAIFTNSIYTVGGEQRVVTLLANELCRNNDVTLFTMDSSKNADNIFNISDDIKIAYYKPYRFDLISFCFRAATHLTPVLVYDLFPSMLERAYLADRYVDMMNSLLDDSYDAVIVTAWQLSIILGKVREKYKRTFKTIAWEHSSYEAYFETKYFYLYKHEELFKKYLGIIDEIVVLNDDYKQKYESKLGLKSIVIYNPKTFASEEKANLTNKTFFVCGRMDEEVKGIDLLFEAFEKFSRSNDDWRLVIAGDGAAFSKYKKVTESHEYGKRVSLLGQITNVRERMLEASVYLLPSRFEGFPMSVTEAFEAGVPVLAFDIPAMKPFVEAGGVIAVDCYDTDAYANAMLSIASDYDLRRTLGDKGVKFADTLDIVNISKKWEEIINE